MSLTTLQGEFQKQVMYLKEQQRLKEEEIEGGWHTEEKMQKELSYSSHLGSGFVLFIFPNICKISYLLM